jgi:hypothetical protein
MISQKSVRCISKKFGATHIEQRVQHVSVASGMAIATKITKSISPHASLRDSVGAERHAFMRGRAKTWSVRTAPNVDPSTRSRTAWHPLPRATVKRKDGP